MNIPPEAVRATLRCAYAFLRLFVRETKCKIVFLSRQANVPSIDFELLAEELKKRNSNVKIVMVCCRMGDDTKSKLMFIWAQLRSLYHLAGSRVCVLDSYSLAVSVVDHRDSLTVFQLWHAMGKIKKSGLQTVGLPQGREQDVADVLRMHHGYDYVIAGAKAWNQAYMASFGVGESQLLNVGLPRADYLLNNRTLLREHIFGKYPGLIGKPIILYAPTFRRGGGVSSRALRLVKRLDLGKYNLVVRGHANQPLVAQREGVFECPEYSGMELLAVASILVTDYSAIAVEAALIDLPTFYYLYDFDDYRETNGLNLDVTSEFPRIAFKTSTDVVNAIYNDYPREELDRYKEKYLFPDPGHSTADIADAIFEKGGLCQR